MVALGATAQQRPHGPGGAGVGADEEHVTPAEGQAQATRRPPSRPRAAGPRREVSGSRTAMRIQVGASPGKLSPRRTAKPCAASPSRADCGPSALVSTSTKGASDGTGAQADRLELRDEHLAVTTDPQRRGLGLGEGRAARDRRPWQRAPGTTPTTAAARLGGQRRRWGSPSDVAGTQARRDPTSWSGERSTSRPVEVTARRSTRLSPGTASMKASSTTSTRPGRAATRAVGAAGCSTAGWVRGVADEEQVAGRATPRRKRSRVEREAVAGPEQGRRTGRLALTRAASGSVNCGCTTRRARPRRPARAMRVKASAPPDVGSTRLPGTPCRRAMVRLGRAGVRDKLAEVCDSADDRLGDPWRGPGRRTLTARSARPGAVLLVAVVVQIVGHAVASSARALRPKRAPRQRSVVPAQDVPPSGCAGRDEWSVAPPVPAGSSAKPSATPSSSHPEAVGRVTRHRCRARARRWCGGTRVR